MAGSVLEQELMRKLSNLQTSVRAHDRGVLIGFLFSLLPIFPLAFVGLGIGLLNLSMRHSGKINEFDFVMVRRGLIFGVINSALSMLILITIMKFASNLELHQLFYLMPNQMQKIIQFLWDIPHSMHTGRLTT